MKLFEFCKDENEWDNLVNCQDNRQNPRHLYTIDYALREKFDSFIKENLCINLDAGLKDPVNNDLISFDPVIEYYPKSYWEVSLIFNTWSLGVISILQDLLDRFCNENNTWFSIWIDAHPMYVILFPQNNILFKYESKCLDIEREADFAMAIAKYGLGYKSTIQIKAREVNWPDFFDV